MIAWWDVVGSPSYHDHCIYGLYCFFFEINGNVQLLWRFRPGVGWYVAGVRSMRAVQYTKGAEMVPPVGLRRPCCDLSNEAYSFQGAFDEM